MKKFNLLIILFFSLTLGINAQDSIPVKKEPKTFVGKGLKEIDKIATKALKDFLKIFKKRPFAYKKGKRRHETKVKNHNPPTTYVRTKEIVTVSRDSFYNFELKKDKKTGKEIKPEIELKVMYPRITPGKGYVSFQLGDYKYKRYLKGLDTTNIKHIKLISPSGDTCQVKKYRILPKKDIIRHFSFILDHSGSMGDARADKLQEGVYKAISNNFEKDINKKSTYSIHKFDGEGRINHLITSKNKSDIYDVLVPPNGLEGYGRSTAIKDALYQGINIISKDTISESKIVVLFTDGYTNTDQIKTPLSDIIRKAIDNNINIVVIGFGRWYDVNYLNAIAYYAGGNSYRIWHENEFNQLFDNIITDVRLSYDIEFSPCMFGDEIQIEMKVEGEEDKFLTGNTFFKTPANQGSSIAVDILFSLGSNKIDEERFENELDQIINFMNFKNNIKILIEGHTDKTGSESLNKNLSLKRANSLKNYLVSNGIDENRIETIGYGWDRPAYPYDGNKKDNPLNRRIEITIN